MYCKSGQACVRSALFYYKLWQTLLQIRESSWIQIRASVVTNWGSYYKLGQLLLQKRAAITNWGKMYYKLGQALQIRATVTKWGIIPSSSKWLLPIKKLESNVFSFFNSFSTSKCLDLFEVIELDSLTSKSAFVDLLVLILH